MSLASKVNVLQPSTPQGAGSQDPSHSCRVECDHCGLNWPLATQETSLHVHKRPRTRTKVIQKDVALHLRQTIVSSKGSHATSWENASCYVGD